MQLGEWTPSRPVPTVLAAEIGKLEDKAIWSRNSLPDSWMTLLPRRRYMSGTLLYITIRLFLCDIHLNPVVPGTRQGRESKIYGVT